MIYVLIQYKHISIQIGKNVNIVCWTSTLHITTKTNKKQKTKTNLLNISCVLLFIYICGKTIVNNQYEESTKMFFNYNPIPRKSRV